MFDLFTLTVYKLASLLIDLNLYTHSILISGCEVEDTGRVRKKKRRKKSTKNVGEREKKRINLCVIIEGV